MQNMGWKYRTQRQVHSPPARLRVLGDDIRICGVFIGGVCPRLLFFLFEQIRGVGNRVAGGNVALTDFKCCQQPTTMIVLLAHTPNATFRYNGLSCFH